MQVLWKWSIGVVAKHWKSLHTRNIFQTKFVEEGPGHFKIVSASADGLVCINTINTTRCEDVRKKKLFSHLGPVHKLAVKNGFPTFLSCGEDAKVAQVDLRTEKVDFLVTVQDQGKKVPLFSIYSHPMEDKFIVAGKSPCRFLYNIAC